MAAYTLFVEDEVCIHKAAKGYCFGLVLGNSEFTSSSEEDEDGDRLQAGTIKVAWHPAGKETVIAENKVHLVDRSLMPGDVVRRLIPGQESQCGSVLDMDVCSHLRVLRSNKYIYNVNSKDLQPLYAFDIGQEVMLDSWLGRVENVVMDAVLVFPDGAKCQVPEGDLYFFEDKVRRHGKFSESQYFPGQELKGPLASLNEAKWLHSTARHSHKAAIKKGKTPTITVTIEKIIVKQVDVVWIFRGYEQLDESEISISTPCGIVEGADLDRLKVLDWFSHCSIQIGDRMVYQVKNDDILSSTPPAKAYDPQAALIKEQPVRVQPEEDNKQNVEGAEGSASNSSQLLKQDGPETNNDGADSDGANNDSEEADDDSDFEDEEEKQGAATRGRLNSAGRGAGGKKKQGLYRGGGGACQRHKQRQQHQKPGGRQSVGTKDRLVKAGDTVEVEVEFNTSWATVMWQDGTVERNIRSVQLFPVHHLDEQEFFPGDYVLPGVDLPEKADYGVLVKADHHERTCVVHWFKAYDVGKATRPTVIDRNVEMSVYDIKDHPDYKFRPGQSVVRVGGFENIPSDSEVASQATGQIFEVDPNGHLVIKWSNGSISQCFPQEVFIVSDETDESDNESWDSGSEYDSDASGDSWETDSEAEVTEVTGSPDAEGTDENLCGQKQELDTLLGRAEAALSRLQKLLNNYDVTVQAPECFVDIIRIYRSCHDLDKILQSSFFNDSELQALIAQAKLELSRDRVNRITRNLSQVFEQWSKSLPVGAPTGSVSVGGKTIKTWTVKNGAVREVNIQVGAGEGKESKTELSGATGGNTVFEAGDQQSETAKPASPPVNSSSDISEVRSIKKECSEPAISELSEGCHNGVRRPSDPVNEYSRALTPGGREANLVGENCVSKAAKRTNSDSYDDSGREVKKIKEDGKNVNNTAQELCYKICQNLQKQVGKIQEEVHKRTRRLMSASKNGAAPAGKSVESTNREDSANVSPTGDGTDEVSEERGGFEGDSTPHSMDEAGERLTAGMAGEGTVCDEGGDVPRLGSAAAAAPRADPGNEGSCEESTSHTSTLSDVHIAPCKGFEIYGDIVSFHKYISQENQLTNPRAFRNCVRKELKLFQTSLPDGIFVKGFEDRLDLYSVMILGPEGTPYEDALFLFDMMLPKDYPSSPPLLHYYSFCNDRLNPNLYECGKVCVSLLGTWSGKGSEVWTSKSNMLQLLLSIQGLILVPEPYYNEAFYEKQRGTQLGRENSRMYNEMALLKTVQSLTRMCHSLPELFKHEIFKYLKCHGPGMISRLRHWMDASEQQRKASHVNPASAPVTRPADAKQQELSNGAESPAPTEDITSEAEQTEEYSSAENTYSPPIGTGRKGEGEAPLAYLTDSESDNPSSLSQPRSSCVDGENFVSGAGVSNIQPTNPGSAPANHSASLDVDAGTPVDVVNRTVAPAGEDLPMSEVSDALPLSVSVSEQEKPASLSHRPAESSYRVNIDDKISSITTDLNVGASTVIKQPEYPLMPMSRGFCLALQKYLGLYEQALAELKDPSLCTDKEDEEGNQEKEILVEA